MRSGRRYRPRDVVYWAVPAGIGDWPTDGVSVIESVDRGVYRMRDGVIVTGDEIRELIAAGNRPRDRRVA